VFLLVANRTHRLDVKELAVWERLDGGGVVAEESSVLSFRLQAHNRPLTLHLGQAQRWVALLSDSARGDVAIVGSHDLRQVAPRFTCLCNFEKGGSYDPLR
jgi:hypothetical protein